MIPKIAVAPPCRSQVPGCKCLGHPEHSTRQVNERNRFLGFRKTRLQSRKIGNEKISDLTTTQLADAVGTSFTASCCSVLIPVIAEAGFLISQISQQVAKRAFAEVMNATAQRPPTVKSGMSGRDVRENGPARLKMAVVRLTYRPFLYGAVAQLARAPRSQRGGRGFEPHLLHSNL